MDTALSVRKREVTGSVASRRLRREGLIPAVLYGHKETAVPLAVNNAEIHSVLRSGARMVDLHFDGQVEKALIKEVQYNVFGTEILHIDFTRIGLGEKVTIKVPIEIRGTHAAVSEGGVLDNLLKEIEIECLATNIPESIVVNVSKLQIGDSIYVKDLEVPQGVSVLDDPEMMVIIVHPPEEEEKETLEEETAAEPEVIERGKPGEAEAEGDTES